MTIETDSDLSVTEELFLDAEQLRLKSKASYKDLRRITGASLDTLHRMRIDGRLPEESVSLEADLNHYIQYLVRKLENKGGEDLMELQVRENLRSTILKNAELSLEIKEKRKEVVYLEDVLGYFQPLFVRLRGQLHSIANAHPETQSMIDSCLRQWNDIGKKLCKMADDDFNEFEQEIGKVDILQLPKLLDLPDLEDI